MNNIQFKLDIHSIPSRVGSGPTNDLTAPRFFDKCQPSRRGSTPTGCLLARPGAPQSAPYSPDLPPDPPDSPSPSGPLITPWMPPDREDLGPQYPPAGSNQGPYQPGGIGASLTIEALTPPSRRGGGGESGRAGAGGWGDRA